MDIVKFQFIEIVVQHMDVRTQLYILCLHTCILGIKVSFQGEGMMNFCNLASSSKTIDGHNTQN